MSAEKVLLIAPQPFFIERGTPMNVRQMSESLGNAGVQVELLAYPLGEDVRIPGVKLLRSPGGFLKTLPSFKNLPPGPSLGKLVLDIFMALSAVSLVCRKKYLVIHGIEEGAFMAGVLARLRGSKFIFDLDSSMSDQLAAKGGVVWGAVGKIFFHLEKFFLNRADAVISVCESLSNKVHELAPQTRVFQIEDSPLDFNQGNQTAESCEDIISKFALKNKKLVVYTGNFITYQGVDLLVRGFSEFVRSDDDESVCLLLVGGGDETERRFQEVRDLAKSLGVGERVIMTGNQPLSLMPEFMELADVLASPRTEGDNTPLKIYSYMAADKPLLATDLFTHTQVLSEETAFLFKPEPKSLASALKEILSSPELARKKSLAAKDLAEKKFSREAFSKKVVEVYKHLGVSGRKTENLEAGP